MDSTPMQSAQSMQVDQVNLDGREVGAARKWFQKPAAIVAVVIVLVLSVGFFVGWFFLRSSSTPAAPAGWQCESSFTVDNVAAHTQKGLAIDDDTFQKCPSNIPAVWPNGKEPVKSIRLFKAWDPNWPLEKRDDAWTAVANFAHKTSAQVLVGTQISCSEEADDADWKNVLELLKRLGAKYVMGVAIGNELELLQFKDKNTVPDSCVEKIWGGGYLFQKFESRVKDLDDLADGFDKVPVTSVFGAAIMADPPFWNTPKAMVLDFFHKALPKFGTRYVHSLNLYPYFDPGNALDPGSTNLCTGALQRSLCWSNPDGCLFPATVKAMRDRMKEVSNQNDVLWITETGWSAPVSSTLSGQPMGNCDAWSSNASFKKYYTGFLTWDLQMIGAKGPDHVFYFTVHDSDNFGLAEHFGLVSTCGSNQCKVQGPTPAPTPSPTPSPTHSPTPSPTPPSDAACNAHPDCKDLLGLCCPTAHGEMLWCCHANSSSNVGLVV